MVWFVTLSESVVILRPGGIGYLEICTYNVILFFFSFFEVVPYNHLMISLTHQNRLEDRCDEKTHCLDLSDEENCKTIITPKNYKSRTPPIKFDATIDTLYAANISIDFTLKNVLEISEIDMKLKLKFAIHLEWIDHRLTYQNLKEKTVKNILTKEEESMIWMPTLIFENTDDNEIVEVDKNSEIMIERKGHPKLSSIGDSDEIYEYNGKENPIAFEQVFTKLFGCNFQLQLYPFDTQICYVYLAVGHQYMDTVEMVPRKIKMRGRTLLPQYVLQKWDLEYNNKTCPSQGLHVRIVLSRRIVSELLTTYLPTLLLILIVHMTNYFKVFHLHTKDHVK